MATSAAVISLTCLLVLLSAAVNSAGQDIGVCYGTVGDNLPPAAEVVGLYQRHNIRRMRLFDPNPAALEAVRGTGIEVTVGIRNEDLPDLALREDNVARWYGINIEPYIVDVVLPYITVGNEVIPGTLGKFVPVVMRSLRNVLDARGLRGIKVTTVVPGNVLAASYPPSSGVFSDEAIADLTGVLGFLSAQGTPLMVNVYPYFAYASDPANVRLDYALFTATGPIVQDGLLSYWNLFDAMVDAFCAAMERAGAADVGLAVSESGWPSAGNGDFTSSELAGTYNRNLVHHLLSGAGTPRRPGTFIQGFVFAMFNEDQKPGAASEQSFGLFYPNMEPVYPVFDVSV